MLTYRMNWMDVEKSKSMEVTVSREDMDLPPQFANKSYGHRRHVAGIIRQRLRAIQRELHHEAAFEATVASPESSAAQALTALVRGHQYREGQVLLSYIDATPHDDVAELDAYNAFCRTNLETIIATGHGALPAAVPSAEDFDAAPIGALWAAADASGTAEELAECEHAVKAYNTRAAKCARYLLSFASVRNAALSTGYCATTTPAPSPEGLN